MPCAAFFAKSRTGHQKKKKRGLFRPLSHGRCEPSANARPVTCRPGSPATSPGHPTPKPAGTTERPPALPQRADARAFPAPTLRTLRTASSSPGPETARPLAGGARCRPRPSPDSERPQPLKADVRHTCSGRTDAGKRARPAATAGAGQGPLLSPAGMRHDGLYGPAPPCREGGPQPAGRHGACVASPPSLLTAGSPVPPCPPASACPLLPPS